MAESHSDVKRTRINNSSVKVADVSKSAPTVQAQPVESYVAPKESALMRLSKGLSQASPQLDSFFKKREEEQSKVSQVEAIEAATRAGGKSESEAIASLQGEHRSQSQEFGKYFMQQMGINNANRIGNELSGKYDVWAAENPNGNLDEFIQGNVASHMEGLEDADYKIGFLETLSPIETKLRQHHTKRVRSELDNESDAMSFEAYSNLFSQVDEETGLYKPVDSAGFSKIARSMNKLGISNAELNSHIYKAAVLASQPDANGVAHPEVFDSLMDKSVNGASSLGYTEDYGKLISTAKQAAENHNKKAKGTLDNQSKTKAWLELSEKMKDPSYIFNPHEVAKRVYDSETNPEGDITFSMLTSLQALDESRKKDSEKAASEDLWFSTKDRVKETSITVDEIRDLPLTQGEKNTLENELQKNIELKEKYSSIGNSITDSKAYTLKGVYSDSDIQKGFDIEVQKILNGAGEEGQAQAVSDVIDISKRNGMMFSPWKGMLDTADPSNPQAWEQATTLYMTLKDNHPSYVGGVFTDEHQVAKFEQYYTNRTMFQQSHEDASEVVSMITKEDVEIAKSVINTKENNILISSRIDNKLKEGNQPDAWFDQSASNHRAIGVKVRKLIEARVARPDHPTITKELVDDMVELVKSQHVIVSGKWIPNTASGAMTPNLSEAVEDYLSPKLVEELGDRAAPRYGLVPENSDLHSGAWLIIDDLGNPLMRNGIRQRIKPEALVRSMKETNGDLLTASDAVEKNREAIKPTETPKLQTLEEMGLPI